MKAGTLAISVLFAALLACPVRAQECCPSGPFGGCPDYDCRIILLGWGTNEEPLEVEWPCEESGALYFDIWYESCFWGEQQSCVTINGINVCVPTRCIYDAEYTGSDCVGDPIQPKPSDLGPIEACCHDPNPPFTPTS